MEKIELKIFDENPTLGEIYEKTREGDMIKIIGMRPGDNSIIAMTIERYHKLMIKLAEGVIDK